MNPDGSEQKNLTNSPGTDKRPQWSPDGKKIVFVSGRDQNREIYVMNADGSGQRNLASDPAEDMEPRWSPDGKKIAFYSFTPYKGIPFLSVWRRSGGRKYICVVNPDGSEKKQLTNTGRDEHPVWSPVPLPTKQP
jgi:TolB protein